MQLSDFSTKRFYKVSDLEVILDFKIGVITLKGFCLMCLALVMIRQGYLWLNISEISLISI